MEGKQKEFDNIITNSILIMDNIALEHVNSSAWCQWTSENWTEKLFRRRMNYTLPYYKKKGSICWIKTIDWMFTKREYESMVDRFWDMQVKEEIK